jgi:DNA invertase Pin-like site-specific DNA recombinase
MTINNGLDTTHAHAVGYTRVSTEEQARDGVSLDAQQARIRAYAEAKGLSLSKVLADEGHTGKNLNRPAMRELLGLCERGQVDAVVVLKLDRLTRHTRHLLRVVEDVFLARDIELHSVSESLDTSTPHGRFVLTLFGGLAQMERELIAERTRAALEYKRQQCQPTSHAPLGFRANGKRHRMLPVPEELEVVRQILTLWSCGSSYASIAAKMNVEGVRTKRGGRWHHTTVSRVVARRDLYTDFLERS